MIVVKGGSKSQKKHIESMVNYCITKLMPRMKNIEITVCLRSLKGEAYGYCLAVDGPRADRPREFEIEVEKSLTLRKLLETVAHEMVHVKQYARGELYEGVRIAKHRWQGKYISNKLSYWDSPWEIEAHGREAGLFVQWAEKERIGHMKWAQID